MDFDYHSRFGNCVFLSLLDVELGEESELCFVMKNNAFPLRYELEQPTPRPDKSYLRVREINQENRNLFSY